MCDLTKFRIICDKQRINSWIYFYVTSQSSGYLSPQNKKKRLANKKFVKSQQLITLPKITVGIFREIRWTEEKKKFKNISQGADPPKRSHKNQGGN